MRILLLSEFFLSGQSTHVLDLAKQLSILGHSVVLVYTRINSSLFYSYYQHFLEEQGIKFLVTKWHRRILSLIKHHQSEIIHVHSSTTFNLARRLAQEAEIPYVVTCHGLGLEQERYHRALSRAARLIAVGPKTAQLLQNRFGPKLEIIRNGVDIDLFRPQVKEEKLRIVYLGRLLRSKLKPLYALAEAVAALPEMSLEIYSSRNLAGSRLDVHPWQPDTAQLLGKANIMAGCGRAAREAMSAGCVVLLMNQNYDGIITPKMVQRPDFDFSGNNGWQTLSRIKKDLAKLRKNSGFRDRLQKFSRDYAQAHLSSRQMAEQTVLAYQAALKT